MPTQSVFIYLQNAYQGFVSEILSVYWEGLMTFQLEMLEGDWYKAL
jgi:hypothetical protein